MTSEPDDDFPVLDGRALRDLKDDAGEAAAQGFIEDYLLLLFSRALKIVNSLSRGSAQERLDAVASLRTSSEMAGAVRLAAYCRRLEAALRGGESPDVTAVGAELPIHVRNVIREASRRGHLGPKPHGSFEAGGLAAGACSLAAPAAPAARPSTPWTMTGASYSPRFSALEWPL
jgi:histidine phosphotransfer protein HptB